MVELANFPMISQRDGDPNQNYDCVAGAIAAGLIWLTGKHFTASQVKDAVYGRAYIGGTDAHKYVAYCAEQGVTLAPMDGAGPQLVADLRAQITAQHPCLVTEPDPYAAGWTHVCAAYKDDGSSITVMDPWIDAPITKSYATWAAQLQDNEIWFLALEDEMISLDDPFVKAHFVQTGINPDRLHCPATGFDLFAGILGGWRRMNGAPRLPKSGEVKCGVNAVYVICEGGILVYDPGYEMDAPKGPWEPCYLLHLDSPLAQKILAIAPPPAQIPASVIDDLRAARTSNAANDAAIARVLMDLGVPI